MLHSYSIRATRVENAAHVYSNSHPLIHNNAINHSLFPLPDRKRVRIIVIFFFILLVTRFKASYAHTFSLRLFQNNTAAFQ